MIRTYVPQPGEHINHAAEAMVKIAVADQCQVKASFNEIELTADPQSTAEGIVNLFHVETERRRAAYEQSPGGIAAAKERQKYEAQAAQAEREGVLPFTLREGAQVGWEDCVRKNDDPYGACCVRYAARWANAMEKAIAAGETIAQCADRCSHEADKEGITGFMYGCAVSMLAGNWTHGEALRLWHNLKTQIGTEGEKANESGGILNPALLNIGPKS